MEREIDQEVETEELEDSFYAVGPDGVERKYDTLFTCDSDDGEKSYIVYTDHSVDEEGNVRVFASTYKPGVENQEYLPIETEREWKIIEMMIKEIQSEVQAQNNENEQ